MASRRNVVTYLYAPARSGKSYNEVRGICDETIPQESGIIYTNLPLKCERIAEYCFRKYGRPIEETLSRLILIPRDVELEWKQAGQPIYDAEGNRTGAHPLTGPWDYFADKPLSGATIIIDEIHNFCGSIGTPKAISNQWQKWLGELGHNQAVFRCITQAPEKVHACIKQEAQAQYTIRNTGIGQDPYFKIEMYDWLELWSGLTGLPYKVFVFEQETRKIEGRATRGKRKMHRMGPPYFDFYDSFNAPIAHQQTENVKPFEHEWERQLRKGPLRGRIGIVLWFVRKNLSEVVSRMFIVALLLTMFIGLSSGRLTRLVTHGVMYLTQSMVKPPKIEAAPDVPVAPKANPLGQEVMPMTEAEKKQAAELQAAQQTAQALNQQLAAIQAEKDKAHAEKERVERELRKASALVLLTRTSITLRGGYTYEIGEQIDVEPYQGKAVQSINWLRRYAVLDDGTRIKLGFEPDVPAPVNGVPQQGTGTIGEPGVSNPVPANGTPPANRTGTGKRTTPANPVNHRNAP